MTVRLSADIGGTFTDIVLLDEEGNLHIHKTPSTPQDFTQGILRGADEILGHRGFDAVEAFVHGATVVLNALLERKLARTGLVTTCGFRDVLEIMRTNNPAMYDLQYDKPLPLVPRWLRLEVSERVRHTGEVRTKLDEATVLEAAARLREAEVEAVAVCLMHSYVNPSHEQAVGRILRDELPGVAICLSSDIAPEWREFERTSTTCVNAATIPIITSYLRKLSDQLRERGLSNELRVMQSNGGVMSSAAATVAPVRTVMSGPSGGVVGAAHLAQRLNCENMVTIDIGGTSSDMGLISRRRATVVMESTVGAGWPILTPMIEIVSIGAGGGSIAWLDTGGALRVGPQSAGAAPGPVCFRAGGTQPTVTDANLVLGRINPEFFLGGAMQLDLDGARKAIATLAQGIGLEMVAAAHGIVEIANTHMAQAVRSILLKRGHDPREFTLMGFGGGGGLHTAAIIRELGIPKGIVPNNPGALSAIGMLGTQYRRDCSRTLVGDLASVPHADLQMALADIAGEASRALIADGCRPTAITLQHSVDLRYAGQEHSLNVGCPADPDREVLARRLHEEHERVYGYAARDFRIEIVNLRASAVGRADPPRFPTIASRGAGPALTPGTARPVYFGTDGWIETPIFSVERFRGGDELPGPCIVEDPRSTMLVLPRQAGQVDDLRNVRITQELT